MIVKRNFSPIKVWAYIRKPMWVVIFWTVAVYLAYEYDWLGGFKLNLTPVAMLASALAIFIAFRNNSAYGRWWEARQLWGGIVNSSRVVARLIISFADSHSHQSGYDEMRSGAFKKEMVYKCIGWVHALWLHLRKQEDWQNLKPWVSAEEWQELAQAQNKPNMLQLQLGRQLYRAMADGTLGGFDSFQIEGQLLALANYQGGCERIKNTPLPRQYDFFTRVFLLLFVLMLPFGLMPLFEETMNWPMIPLSILISGVFVIMERTGAANEDPFENRVTDVPLTALCITIERDLKEMLGEKNLPAAPVAINGYLS